MRILNSSEKHGVSLLSLPFLWFLSANYVKIYNNSNEVRCFRRLPCFYAAGRRSARLICYRYFFVTISNIFCRAVLLWSSFPLADAQYACFLFRQFIVVISFFFSSFRNFLFFKNPRAVACSYAIISLRLNLPPICILVDMEVNYTVRSISLVLHCSFFHRYFLGFC